MREKEKGWKRDRERDGGGERGERPQGALFFISSASYYLCALQSRMGNGKRLFMRLCANAPASLMIRGLFFPALAIMTLTVKEDESMGLPYG